MTLTGADSVNANSLPKGKNVYPYYAAGTFANGTAVKRANPGKLYFGITPRLGLGPASCLDVENGDAAPSDAPHFVENWKMIPGETNRPVIYANASTMPAVKAALTGVARTRYYLWVAEWDNNPAIPAGYDGKQYANNPSYDSNTFATEMFYPPSPPKPHPENAPKTTIQVEYFEDGFGWVLIPGLSCPVTSKIRVRVSHGTWSGWTEIKPG